VFDWITPAELPIGATLCNTHEHETTIAEHLMAGMLEWQTGLMRDTHPVMQKYSFNGRDINKGPHHRELRGSTVGIIGYGHIGREIARRCKAFDMTVMAVSRTMRKEPELVDWYGTVEDLDALLQRSDFIINCAPGGEETRGMIDRRCFSMMKSDAIIANVGRGEVIDEKALYEALSSRRIRGGIIDVWYKYPGKKNPNPWPSKFPFHKLDNIIMSPHNSAWTQAMSHRRWDFVAANLDRLSKGLELKNFCFKGERVD
jgi:phosphoglycerate dehydrogenase-like enzyme